MVYTVCRVLGYTSAVNIGTWRAFRNYSNRHHAYDPTILEAICACWTTPPSFKGVVVGTEIEKSEVISAVSAFPNPALQAIQEASDLYGPDRRVGLLLSLGSGAPTHQQINGDTHLVQAEVTARELERRFGTTGIYYRLSVIPSLASAENMTQETLGVISAHTSDFLLNPVTDRVLDQVVKASSHASRFTLISMSELFSRSVRHSLIAPLGQVTAPLKVSFSGLPPLSPYFIQRDIPLNHMTVSLLGSELEERQRLLILTGMGGSGKTQMVIAFIREHGEWCVREGFICLADYP